MIKLAFVLFTVLLGVIRGIEEIYSHKPIRRAKRAGYNNKWKWAVLYHFWTDIESWAILFMGMLVWADAYSVNTTEMVVKIVNDLLFISVVANYVIYSGVLHKYGFKKGFWSDAGAGSGALDSGKKSKWKKIIFLIVVSGLQIAGFTENVLSKKVYESEITVFVLLGAGMMYSVYWLLSWRKNYNKK